VVPVLHRRSLARVRPFMPRACAAAPIAGGDGVSGAEGGLCARWRRVDASRTRAATRMSPREGCLETGGERGVQCGPQLADTGEQIIISMTLATANDAGGGDGVADHIGVPVPTAYRCPVRWTDATFCAAMTAAMGDNLPQSLGGGGDVGAMPSCSSANNRAGAPMPPHHFRSAM